MKTLAELSEKDFLIYESLLYYGVKIQDTMYLSCEKDGEESDAEKINFYRNKINLIANTISDISPLLKLRFFEILKQYKDYNGHGKETELVRPELS